MSSGMPQAREQGGCCAQQRWQCIRAVHCARRPATQACVAGEGQGRVVSRQCGGGPSLSDQAQPRSFGGRLSACPRTLLTLATGEATPSSWSL